MRGRQRDRLDQLGALLETRPIKFALVALVALSVLPYPWIERTFRPLFLTVFGGEVLVRGLLLFRRRVNRRRSETLFLLLDSLAFLTFLPLGAWLQTPGGDALVRGLRLLRLLVLLRFARELAWDVYSVMTRREQLQQFGLVTTAVATLTFVTAVVLTYMPDVEHDYDAVPGEPETLWDRMWWAFRQIESADNLVQNLHVHPVVAVVSLALTITGVFIISYIIGIGANVVDQVVRAERRRPVGYQGHSLVIGPVQEREILVREFVRIYDKNRALRRIRALEVWRWLFGGAPTPRRHALPRMALLGPEEYPPGYLYEPGKRWVVYRKGNAADAEDLARVAAGDAKRVLILGHSHAGHDADALSVAGLAALREANPHAYVLVEVLDSGNAPIVKQVGGEGTFPLDVPRFLGLFLCHHLVVPGVEPLFQELLSSEGSEFYSHVFVDPAEQRQLARRQEEFLSFEDMARSAYEHCGVLLVGVFLSERPLQRKPWQLVPVDELVPWINPRTVPEDGERLRELGASPGRVPLRTLRGVMGIAETYLPLRRYALALCSGRGAEAAPRGDHRAVPEYPLTAPERRFRRVLIVGYSPALRSLLQGLARFVPEVEVTLVLGVRPDSPTPLRTRLQSLGLGLRGDDPPGETGRTVGLERGGQVTVHSYEGPGTVDFAMRCVGQREPLDVAVFLSDPESRDRDARTALRVLRFARALGEGDGARTGEQLHMLVELESLERGERLRSQVDAQTCGLADGQLRLTLVSTDQIRNYFMVHSAFVPGVTEVYDRLLGSRDQEIVRLDVPGGWTAAPMRFRELVAALGPREAIPIAVEFASGTVRANPKPHETFDASQVRAVIAIAESDQLADRFPEH